MEQGEEALQQGPVARESTEALIARLSPTERQELNRVAASLAIAFTEAIRQVLEAMAGPNPAEP